MRNCSSTPPHTNDGSRFSCNTQQRLCEGEMVRLISPDDRREDDGSTTSTVIGDLRMGILRQEPANKSNAQPAIVEDNVVRMELAKAFMDAKRFEDSDQVIHPFLLFIGIYNPICKRGWLKALFHNPSAHRRAEISAKLDEVLVCLYKNILRGKTGLAGGLRNEVGQAWDISHASIKRKLKNMALFNDSLGVIETRHTVALSYGSSSMTATNVVAVAVSPEKKSFVSERKTSRETELFPHPPCNLQGNKEVLVAINAESEEKGESVSDDTRHFDLEKRLEGVEVECQSLRKELISLKKVLKKKITQDSRNNGALNYKVEEVNYGDYTYPCYLPVHHNVVAAKELSRLRDRPSVAAVNGKNKQIEEQEKQNQDLVKYKEKWGNIKKIYQRKHYHPSSKWGRLYLGLALTLCPKGSDYTMEQVVSFLHKSFLADIGMDEQEHFELSEIGSATPCRSTLKTIRAELGAYVYVYMQVVLEKAKGKCKFFLTTDKSNRGRGRDSVSHLVQCVCFFNEMGGEVCSFMYSACGSQGTSAGCAHAVDHALWFSLDNVIEKFHGTGGDNGGGDSGETLWKELKKINRTEGRGVFPNCAHHNLALTLSTPQLVVFGTGGLGKRNIFQELHNKADFQNSFETREFDLAYEVLRQVFDENKDPNALDIVEVMESAPKQKATIQATQQRWNSVEPAVKRGIEKNDHLLNNTEAVLVRDSSEKAAHKIAGSLISLSRECALRVDAFALRAFNSVYANWAYHAFADCGPATKRNGFNSPCVLLVYYIIQLRLSRLVDDGWRNCHLYDGVFQQYLNMIETELTVENINETILDAKKNQNVNTDELLCNEEAAKILRENAGIKMNKLMREAKKQADKWYERWSNNELLVCALGEGGLYSSIVANFLLHADPSQYHDLEATSFLYRHKCTEEEIEVNDMYRFLSLVCRSRDEVVQEQWFEDNIDGIRLISKGGNMWEDEELHDFREFFKRHLMTTPSTNQFLELAFKTCTELASVKGRSEVEKSMQLSIQTTLLPMAKKNAWRKANERAKSKGKELSVTSDYIRGSILSQSLAESLKKLVDTVDAVPGSAARVEKMQKRLLNPKDHFVQERCRVKTEAFVDALKKGKRDKYTSCAAATGFDETDFVQGNLRFSAITRQFIPLLIEELRCRGYEIGKRYCVKVRGKSQAFDLNEETKITLLKNLLKSDIGCLDNAAIKSFKPRYRQLFDACHDGLKDTEAAATVTESQTADL